MTPRPLDAEDLAAMLLRELADCFEAQRELFARTRIEPARWRLSPWGDGIGDFWAVAVHRDRVVWFNEIEDGFNVSTFTVQGEIPTDQYWCNQDLLKWALPRLEGDMGTRLGPPQPIPGA